MNLVMAVGAKSDGVFYIIRSTLIFWHDVVKLYFVSIVADAAHPSDITEQFISFILVKAHAALC